MVSFYFLGGISRSFTYRVKSTQQFLICRSFPGHPMCAMLKWRMNSERLPRSSYPARMVDCMGLIMESRGKNNSLSDKAVLIYDGGCPICRSTVEWIKEHEQKNAFEMLPCRSEDRKKRYPFMEEATCMQAMQLVLPDGNALAGEKALPEIFKRLRRYRAAAALFNLPGSNTIARAFYRWFADRRYRIANILFPQRNHTHHHGKKAA